MPGHPVHHPPPDGPHLSDIPAQTQATTDPGAQSPMPQADFIAQASARTAAKASAASASAANASAAKALEPPQPVLRDYILAAESLVSKSSPSGGPGNGFWTADKVGAAMASAADASDTSWRSSVSPATPPLGSCVVDKGEAAKASAADAAQASVPPPPPAAPTLADELRFGNPQLRGQDVPWTGQLVPWLGSPIIDLVFDWDAAPITPELVYQHGLRAGRKADTWFCGYSIARSRTHSGNWMDTAKTAKTISKPWSSLATHNSSSDCMAGSSGFKGSPFWPAATHVMRARRRASGTTPACALRPKHTKGIHRKIWTRKRRRCRMTRKRRGHRCSRQQCCRLQSSISSQCARSRGRRRGRKCPLRPQKVCSSLHPLAESWMPAHNALMNGAILGSIPH